MVVCEKGYDTRSRGPGGAVTSGAAEPSLLVLRIFGQIEDLAQHRPGPAREIPNQFGIVVVAVDQDRREAAGGILDHATEGSNSPDAIVVMAPNQIAERAIDVRVKADQPTDALGVFRRQRL